MSRTAGYLRCCLFLTAATWAVAGSAETLQEAWQQALSHDQGLAAATADAASASASERAARAARWPTVSANAGYNRLNASPTLEVATPGGAVLQSGPIFQDNQYVSGGVQLRVPLYAGGQIVAGIQAAHDAAAGANDMEHAAVQTLKLEVAEAYVAVLRARRALRSADSSVSSLSAHVSDVESLVRSDSAPRSDLLAAQVALANAQQMQVRAANDVDSSLAAYNRYLGQPLERSIDLDDSLPVQMDFSTSSVDSLVLRALAQRDELKATGEQAAALAAQARAEAAKLLPQVSLGGSYVHFDNQILDRQDFSMVGVGVTWSLFDAQAHRRSSALRTASHAQQARLEDLRSKIALEVRQAWLAVRAAQARLQASGSAVSQAQENLRISQQLYTAGEAANTQVLDAVTLQINATNNRDDALLDLALSRLRLARALGEL